MVIDVLMKRMDFVVIICVYYFFVEIMGCVGLLMDFMYVFV